MISVTILTKNCERTLKATLESVKDFKDIVILDTGSSDKTLEIATTFPNVRIFTSPFLGFGKLHNLATSYALFDWVFSLDSDEVLTEELAEEVLHLQRNPAHAYAVLRHNFFNGKQIKWCGGWHPDWVLRLYHRQHHRFSEDAVHEKLLVQKECAMPLQGVMLHTPYREMGDFLSKMQLYTSLFAEEHKYKKRGSLTSAIFHGWFSFIKSYILKRGFLGGREGFIISLYNAHTAFYKYLKLEEKNRNPS